MSYIKIENGYPADERDNRLFDVVQDFGDTYKSGEKRYFYTKARYSKDLSKVENLLSGRNSGKGFYAVGREHIRYTLNNVVAYKENELFTE